MQASARVILNTGVQYVRTLVNVSIGLYSSRLVLNALGVNEFGVYNLVAGIVTMLSFLNTSLAGTTQRFLSFHQGDSLSFQQKIFNTSLLIHFGLGIVLFCLIEFVGLFLFDGFLNIPLESLHAAKVIYHFMGVTLFFTLLSTPFYALLVAHENILYVSIVQIIDAICKLSIAIFINYFESERLLYYGLLISSIVVLDFVLYYVFCNKRYQECQKISIVLFDKGLFSKILNFAGWNIYGSGCMIVRTQGIAVLLNKFLGSGINAAYAIALQFQGGISFLSTSILQAIRPQIIKSEGYNDRQRMFRLTEIASKFSFFLLSMVAIPCICEMESVLHLWLGEVPENSVLFCQFMLVAALLDQLTIALGDANQAVGNIKKYTLTIQTLKLLTVPIVIFGLLLGCSLMGVMIIYIVFEGICSLLRLPLLKISTGLSIKSFVLHVFRLELVPFVLFVIIAYVISHYATMPYRFIFTFFIPALVYVCLIYLIGLNKNEKELLKQFYYKLKIKS